jgi:hypothetical protein
MISKKLQLLFLLLGISSLFLSCGDKAPPVTWCIFDDQLEVFDCVSPDGKQTQVSLRDARKYVCQSPRDAQIVQTYVAQLESDLTKCQGK